MDAASSLSLTTWYHEVRLKKGTRLDSAVNTESKVIGGRIKPKGSYDYRIVKAVHRTSGTQWTDIYRDEAKEGLPVDNLTRWMPVSSDFLLYDDKGPLMLTVAWGPTPEILPTLVASRQVNMNEIVYAAGDGPLLIHRLLTSGLSLNTDVTSTVEVAQSDKGTVMLLRIVANPVKREYFFAKRDSKPFLLETEATYMADKMIMVREFTHYQKGVVEPEVYRPTLFWKVDGPNIASLVWQPRTVVTEVITTPSLGRLRFSEEVHTMGLIPALRKRIQNGQMVGGMASTDVQASGEVAEILDTALLAPSNFTIDPTPMNSYR
jgi:hypothetical protein